MTDKERDDALITEAYRRSMEDAEYDKTLSGSAILELRCRHLLRLERSGWKPKPDRAEVLFDECGNWSKAEQLAIIRRHFDELRAEIEAERPAVVVPNEEQIKQMVTRFLGWKLPDDFHPDDGISFEPEFNKEWNASQGKPPQRHTPTGTNLFNYTQAEAMVRYILDGAKGGAATSIDVHQRRGIMATCITLALRDYDEWQKDDDYNFIAALERVINHLEPAREVALQEFSQ